MRKIASSSRADVGVLVRAKNRLDLIEDLYFLRDVKLANYCNIVFKNCKYGGRDLKSG